MDSLRRGNAGEEKGIEREHEGEWAQQDCERSSDGGAAASNAALGRIMAATGGSHGGGWISMNNNTTINLTPQSDVYACGLNCCWNNIETDKSTVLAWSAGLINA